MKHFILTKNLYSLTTKCVSVVNEFRLVITFSAKKRITETFDYPLKCLFSTKSDD